MFCVWVILLLSLYYPIINICLSIHTHEWRERTDNQEARSAAAGRDVTIDVILEL